MKITGSELMVLVRNLRHFENLVKSGEAEVLKFAMPSDHYVPLSRSGQSPNELTLNYSTISLNIYGEAEIDIRLNRDEIE